MRYLLKRKSDGTFYRGREYKSYRDDMTEWSEDPNKAFLFKNESSPRQAKGWFSNAPRCTCSRGLGYSYRRRTCKKDCPYRVALKRNFDKLYEIVPVTIGIKL